MSEHFQKVCAKNLAKTCPTLGPNNIFPIKMGEKLMSFKVIVLDLQSRPWFYESIPEFSTCLLIPPPVIGISASGKRLHETERS